MKKKVAIFVKRLGIGGIGRACINYIKYLDTDYDITLFLENKEGEYLEEIPNDVKIIDFNLSKNSNVILRKLSNFYKLILFKIKYYHKFDFSCNFSTAIKSGAILSKYFSKNSAYWFHGNYWENQKEADTFLNHFTIKKYQKIVFVSNYSKDLYLKAYPNTKQKLYVINNPINYQEIIEKSKEKINIKSNKKVFLNVGRHEEFAKRLTIMINTINRLIKEKYQIELWLVGDGPDTNMYKQKVHDLKLDDYIKFLGFSSNVYPYYKKSDAILLSSHMEGNPVVYLEAKVLNKPIISTDVADAKYELDGYGIVTKCDEESFYLGVKEFLDHGYQITKKFDGKKYNENILEKVHHVIED